MANPDALSIIRSLSDYAANTIAPAFANVGKGIGAVMLLIVVIYYISSILDGGKFQIKMLLPLLIFFFVCNFSWISTPVTSFITTITESLVSACDNVTTSIKEENNCSETANINDLYNEKVREKYLGNDDALKEQIGKSDEQTDPDFSSTDNNQPEKASAAKTKGLSGVIQRSIDKEVNNLSYKTQQELGGEKYAAVGDTDQSKKHLTDKNLTFQSFVCSIISWICDIMSYVLMAFGGVMSGLIIAFGSITFAFAIIPGQGGTIKSWLIRLCQFSLWAPICSVINCFSYKVFDLMVGVGSGASVLMAIAVAVCNLVALTAVPTIASMIIEGAQGAVSLSNGLQSIGSALTGGLTAAGAIGGAVVGNDNVQKAKDTVTGLKNSGVVGTVQDMRTSGHTFKGMLGRMQANGRASRLGKK